MSKKVLAFDFGGSTGRALLGRIDNGVLVYEEVARFDNVPIEDNGYMCWDFQYLLSEVKKCLQKAAAYSYDSISIDTWGVDYGIIDSNGNLKYTPVHYRDDRTVASKEALNKLISPEKLYSISGIQDMRINSVYQLYSDKLAGRLEKGDTVLFMPDLFAYMLTGVKRTEYSIASTSAMIDARSREWSEEILSVMGLDESIMPKIISAGDEYGKLSLKICEELAIPCVPVVAVCGHDTASAIVSVPSTNESDIYISCGTWSLMGTLIDTPSFDNPDFTNEGGADKKITYLSNIMGLWIMQETRRIWKREIPNLNFAMMDEFMQDCSKEHFIIDPNAEDFVAPDNMVDAISDYIFTRTATRPTTKGDIVRCIYESLALSYKRTYNGLGASGNIHIIGGGSKASPLCQLTANITGAKVYAGPVEATAIGNMLTALIYLREIKDYSMAKELVMKSENVKMFTPDNSQYELYEKLYSELLQHIENK